METLRDARSLSAGKPAGARPEPAADSGPEIVLFGRRMRMADDGEPAELVPELAAVSEADDDRIERRLFWQAAGAIAAVFVMAAAGLGLLREPAAKPAPIAQVASADIERLPAAPARSTAPMASTPTTTAAAPVTTVPDRKSVV